MKRQSGFTLIEMVAVIIILAILAAVAFPRFTNLTAKARLSTLNGFAGSLRSAAMLAKSTWLTEVSAGNVDTIEMNGKFVSVVTRIDAPSNPEWWGTPVNNLVSGILLALDNPDGFSSALIALPGTAAVATSGVAFWPTGVAVSAYCSAYYMSGVVTLSQSATGVSATSACF